MSLELRFRGFAVCHEAIVGFSLPVKPSRSSSVKSAKRFTAKVACGFRALCPSTSKEKRSQAALRIDSSAAEE
jgi:hypothetical protein